MSVVDGQRASAAILNAAFVSKLDSSTMVDSLTLADTAADSGPTVTNVQKSINEMTFKTTATQSITNGGTINVTDYIGMQYRRVVGSSAAVTCSTTPFGNVARDIPDGTLIRLVGQDNGDTVSLVHSDISYGCILNGDCTLGQYDVITLQWDSYSVRYIEVGRNF